MAVAKVEGKVRKGAVQEDDPQALEGGQGDMPQDEANRLSELGEKIFLDRYALKDVAKETLAVGDTVVVCVDLKTGQREIGTIRAIDGPTVSVELRDGTLVERATEHVDKPLELRPSRMLDRVARGVAAAEPPEHREEWTERFRWLMEGWKFVPAGRILTAAGSDQQLTWYNCMPPEQEVWTADGYKPIAEVKVGDLVVTHRNRLRPVLHKFERETEEPLYIIRPRKLGFDDLRVTGEHKVLAIRSEWLNQHPERGGARLHQEPEWIPARELRPGDFLAVAHDGTEAPVAPISLSEHVSGYQLRDGALFKPQQRSEYHGYLQASGTRYDVRDRLEVDHDLCYLFGRWLGDGCVTHRTKTDIPSGIKIVFGLDEREEAERIAQIIEAKFGVSAALKVSSTERWLDLWVNSMAVGEFFKAFFGCYSYGKCIPARFMRLPQQLTLGLLTGLFAADGYVSGNKLGIVLSNRVLATQVHQLLLRLGFLFSIWENTHRLGRWPAYRIQATANECGPLFKEFFGVAPPAHDIDLKYYFEHDGLRWLRIAEIAVEDYSGVVLDLEVEEDHSFISAGVVVSNCYVIPSPHDSRAGIVQTLSNMMEVMSRGGGVGINLSSLRPRHAYVRGVNGRSSGAVSWGALYSFVTGLIEQGGSRRGALMLITNIWHPDVLEFISSKREMGKITNANISVGITDDFMAAVEADADWSFVFPDTGDPDYNTLWDGNLEAWKAHGKKLLVHKTVPARDVWNAIIESAWASAEPGVFFVDRYNKMSNSWYFAPILCTNPCVTGDTLVSTEHGYVPARDLQVGMKIRTPLGLKPIEKLHRNGVQRIWRIEFSDGGALDCTADHKLKVVRGKKYEWVATSELKLGDKVLVMPSEAFHPAQRLPKAALEYIQKRELKLTGDCDRQIGFLVGVVLGDGCFRRIRTRNSHSYICRVAFGAHEREWRSTFESLLGQIGIHSHYVEKAKEFVGDHGETVAHSSGALDCYKLGTLMAKLGMEPNVKSPEKKLPEEMFRLDREFLAGVLDGLFSTDGSVLMKADNPMLRFHTASKALAEQVRLLLLQFGIHARIYRVERAPELEYDGRSMYGTGVKYDVLVMNEGVARFDAAIGLSHPEKAARLKHVADDWHCIGGTWTASVLSVIDTAREEEVFDVYEPETLTWVTNGYVSLDCGEQGLPAFGVCNLGAINLSKFVRDADVDWDSLGSAVRTAVRFLDDVIDATPYFFDDNERQQKSERRVGLNTMGLAEMLIRLKIRYGSQESLAFIDKLYRFIAGEAYFASCDLAQEKGAFPAFDAEKFLQSGFMQSMPEDVRAAVREKGCRNVTLLTQAPNGTIGTMVGTSTGIEPFYFWTYYRKSRLGMHEERVGVLEAWHREHPDAEPPSYFVNAMDLTPEEHVTVQAAIQRWVDSSISKTCNVPNSYTVAQTRELYELMYRLGCKGGTIYRDGSRDEQVLNLKKEEPDASPAPARPLTQMEKVRPRPDVCRGVTVKKATPVGTAFVTMNDDEAGQPFEVFVETGKTGSDIKAMAEAMGRLMSLVLRLASPLTPREKVQQIVNQVRGIGGARSLGFGKDRVRSLPDAVAQALEEQYAVHANGNGHHPASEGAASNVNGRAEAERVPTDLCPSCGVAAFIHEEGCMSCHSCGYSEC